jgi:Nuclease-related domain
VSSPAERSAFMIVKEPDPIQAEDRFGRAGRDAEEQMAFYLRRAFGDDPSILVFNGIRLEADGDAVQVDHLILHPYGMIIVESKSVNSRIRVNTQGEWTRWYNGRAQGMASPVLQAERQRDFLRAYLQRDPSVLGGKNVAINVRVAISDRGVIDRRRSGDQDELDSVYKADQIPDEILETIKERRFGSHMPAMLLRLAGATPGVHIGDPLTQSDLDRLRTFLLQHHSALKRSAQPGAAPPAHAATSSRSTATADSNGTGTPACSRCRGTDLKLDYYYNYFLRCNTCRAATALVLRCARCGAQHGKILKSQTAIERGSLCIRCSGCGMAVPLPAPSVASTSRR